MAYRWKQPSGWKCWNGWGIPVAFLRGNQTGQPSAAASCRKRIFGHEAIDEITHVSFSNDWRRQVAQRGNPEVYAIYTQVTSRYTRPRLVTQRIHELRDYLKDQLYSFVRDFHVELLVVENALSIPMNIPLGLALTEFIAETGLPTLAHHHDFYWERERFLVNCVADYLNAAFPPTLPGIKHVVINSIASRELSHRTGISPMVVPNVMDFEEPPPQPDEYAGDIRAVLGVQVGERFFLQPTRVVQRKGIEHAIELDAPDWVARAPGHLACGRR